MKDFWLATAALYGTNIEYLPVSFLNQSLYRKGKEETQKG